MQHEAFANTEDFGGADVAIPPHKPSRPGEGAYANYVLGKAYDEMFAPDGTPRAPYAALDSRVATLPLEELNRRQQACEQSFLHQGIEPTQAPVRHEDFLKVARPMPSPATHSMPERLYHHQQQQQQQQ